LNRSEVLFMSVGAGADGAEPPKATGFRRRRVVVHCGARKLSGILVIDLPAEHSRVLDYLNQRGIRFVTLRDGSRHHLVQKNRITRVEEARED
jgi:tryptophan synthase alpha subunit